MKQVAVTSFLHLLTNFFFVISLFLSHYTVINLLHKYSPLGTWYVVETWVGALVCTETGELAGTREGRVFVAPLCTNAGVLDAVHTASVVLVIAPASQQHNEQLWSACRWGVALVPVWWCCTYCKCGSHYSICFHVLYNWIRPTWLTSVDTIVVERTMWKDII